MIKIDSINWEDALNDLTRLAVKYPTQQVYLKLADCYQHLDERDEARVMMDLSRHLPDQLNEEAV